MKMDFQKIRERLGLSSDKPLTPEEKRRRARYIVYPFFCLLCAGFLLLVFSPSEKEKAEMEKEKYHATKLSYDELRSIRHEIKNHNFYMKALLDEGKTAEAKEYLDRVSSQGTKYLKSFDSGNYAVDVVMNHEMAAAKEQGVVLDTSILVPRKLPLKDEDLCSLLSICWTMLWRPRLRQAWRNRR